MRETIIYSMMARLTAFLALWIASSGAIACSCVPPPPTAATYRALAEWEVNRSAVVFEGKVERISVNGWPITPVAGKTVTMRAGLSVSFSGVRAYRGEATDEVKVETGLGGGDCGFPFEHGESYLIFAWRENNGALSTGICSGTAKLRNAGAELRLLRREPPTSSDLTDLRGHMESAAPATSSSSRVCGKIAMPKGVKPAGTTVIFWPVADEETALFRYLTADARTDGSYCIDLEPGNYLAGAWQDPEKRPPTYLLSYYPGVAERSQAKPITVITGKNENLDFPLLSQTGYRIHGYVRGCPEVPQRPILVVLMSDVGDHFHVVEPAPLGPHGSFDFAGILPGHYTAFAGSDNGDDSFTFLSAGVAVVITGDLEGLRLDYVGERER